MAACPGKQTDDAREMLLLAAFTAAGAPLHPEYSYRGYRAADRKASRTASGSPAMALR